MTSQNRTQDSRISKVENSDIESEIRGPQDGETRAPMGREPSTRRADSASEGRHTISAASAVQYRRKAEALIQRFEQERGLMWDDSLKEFRDWFENSVLPTVNSSKGCTWRSALCFHYREVLNSDAAIRAKVRKSNAKPVNPADRKPAAPAQKGRPPRVKTTPKDQYFRLIKELANKKGFHPHLAGALLVAGRTFGLRPIEWLTAQLRYHSDPGGGPTRFTLTVDNDNAKHPQERTFGKTRILHTDETLVARYEIEAALHVLNVFPEYARQAALRNPGILEQESRLLDPTRKALRRVVTELGWKSRICLYSARHQFAADAKASGVTVFELAAMMGHASIHTAQEHYGRPKNGWGTPKDDGRSISKYGFRLSPHPDDVQAVVDIHEAKSGDFVDQGYLRPKWVPGF